MTIIQEIQASMATGLTLAEALTTLGITADESNVKYWKRILKNQADPTKLKKRRTTRRQSRSTGRPSKRTNYASQVLARGVATVALVDRVNAEVA